MALQRRLTLSVLTLSFLLTCVYFLFVSLETPLSWSTVPLKSFTQAASSSDSPPGSPPHLGSRDSEESVDRRSNRYQRTHPAPASTSHLEPAHATKASATDNNVPLQASDRPRAAEGEETRTKGPTLQPQQATQAARPTEPPFIGDTYMSEVISPQTACHDGVRSHIGKTEFGAKFLTHIPVLQWAPHATDDQYHRLSRYPGAYGWESLDNKTLVETLSVLNSSANGQMLDDWKDRNNKSECIQCAVVGNGGILKDSKKGKEIDSHHYVFRTNGAVIVGFERDVGSRTTHYTFSTNTLMNSMRSYAGVGYRGPPLSEETRYVFLPDHDRDYLLVKAAATHTLVERGPERAKDPSQYFGEGVSAGKLKMYHPDFIRYLRNRFLRSSTLKTKYRNIYRPSTGAVMLLAALHTCDKVSAYGFMTPDYKNYSDHYYDSTYHPVGFYINHDLRMEMSLWQQLHQAGLIRLYMHK